MNHPSPNAGPRSTVKIKRPLFVLVYLLFVLFALSSAVSVQAAAWLQTEPPATHTVQPGETLSEIAAAYGVSAAELMALNQITDPDTLFSGQELQLPPSASPLADLAIDLPTHHVQSGQTLSEIAKQHGVSQTRLMYLNGVSDPNQIYSGQVLRLPVAITPSPEATQPALPTPPAATHTQQPSAKLAPSTHRVAVGETLSEIAKGYGVPLAALMQANGITDADAIYVGQTLHIPVSELTGATATLDATLAVTAERDQPADAPTEPTATPINALPTNRIATLNQSYTVRIDDTLARIARRKGVDLAALARLNGLSSESALVVGDALLLPATSDELRVTTPERDYVVQAGDTLSAIAQAFDLTLSDLMAANYLGNPDSITVGQRLTIPGQRARADKSAGPLAVGPMRSGYYYYTVQSGDTLSELAKQFNSTTLALLDYNGLPNLETVYRGLELRIPYGPPPLPLRLPPVPTSGVSFLVSLSRQECWLLQGKQVRHAWQCSTGYGEWVTRTGNFAVQSKIENAQSSAYRLDMPYWLGIYHVGSYENGIHGLPVDWDTGEKIWTTLIGQPATFGCAMLKDEDAAELFRLAYVGMPVYIVN
jgi:LysM repeat protein